MSGRLAIDFGTSNTVVAIWDEVQKEGVPFYVDLYGHYQQQGTDQIPIIPSLIHYKSENEMEI